ncbi:HEAT repeat domain-containing protein [Ignavibacterium sp.]|uniref:HEAT repeat domain-containing protein n=1 Tax=Ignavibacterium sp. TaxID=2651167 RepID=UPI00307D41D3
MKTLRKQNSGKKFFGLVVSIVFLFAALSFSQAKYLKDFTQHKYAYENLSAAIKSANDGVREDAIYLVGKYKLLDFENDLLNQIEKEKNPDIKVLIGLALFRIGSEKGMQKMLELSTGDSNQRVRRMSGAIYNEYLSINSNRTVAR